jgi:hypothetical protein
MVAIAGMKTARTLWGKERLLKAADYLDYPPLVRYFDRKLPANGNHYTEMVKKAA